MVKGYEFAKDQYVTFTEEELKAMAEESTRTIEITEFVPAAKVDPVYFEGAYYLGPDKGGERAYALLAAAMRETGRSALAKWAARGKQYLVMVRAVEKGLVMQVLHYADEVRPISEVPIGDTAVKEAELRRHPCEQIATDESTRSYETRAQAYLEPSREGGMPGVTAAAPDAPSADRTSLCAQPVARSGGAGRPARPAKRANRPPRGRRRRARRAHGPRAAGGLGVGR